MDAEYLHERCERCQKRYRYVWFAPDVYWTRYSPHGDESGLLCIPCFDALVRDRGEVLMSWTCHVSVDLLEILAAEREAAARALEEMADKIEKKAKRCLVFATRRKDSEMPVGYAVRRYAYMEDIRDIRARAAEIRGGGA